MNCPCGGHTVTAKSKSGAVTLRYERCGSCGRCGRFELCVSDRRFACGEVARRAFQDDQLLNRLTTRSEA